MWKVSGVSVRAVRNACSAACKLATRCWLGPLTFLGAMTLGALFATTFGEAGSALPLSEPGIAASVLLLGLMLAFVKRVPPALGLALIAAAASLHGLAHGGELPAGSSFASYAAGFLLTTAALHLGGLGLQLARVRVWAWRAAGALVGGAGLAMLAQL